MADPTPDQLHSYGYSLFAKKRLKAHKAQGAVAKRLETEAFATHPYFACINEGYANAVHDYVAGCAPKKPKFPCHVETDKIKAKKREEREKQRTEQALKDAQAGFKMTF